VYKWFFHSYFLFLINYCIKKKKKGKKEKQYTYKNLFNIYLIYNHRKKRNKIDYKELIEYVTQ